MIRTSTKANRNGMASFIASLERARKSSAAGTKSTQKRSFPQSPDLSLFTEEQRAGKAVRAE